MMDFKRRRNLFLVIYLFLVQVQVRVSLKSNQSSMRKQRNWERQLNVSNTYEEVYGENGSEQINEKQGVVMKNSGNIVKHNHKTTKDELINQGGIHIHEGTINYIFTMDS